MRCGGTSDGARRRGESGRAAGRRARGGAGLRLLLDWRGRSGRRRSGRWATRREEAPVRPRLGWAADSRMVRRARGVGGRGGKGPVMPLRGVVCEEAGGGIARGVRLEGVAAWVVSWWWF